MKEIKVLIFFFVLGLSFFVTAQEVKPIKVSVEKGISGESFSKTALNLEFWLQEQAKMVAIDEINSKVIELKTNTGSDLLKEHKKAVVEYKDYVEEQAKKGRYMFSSRSENLIDFNKSKPFRDTLGFKLVVDSWAIPPRVTTDIKIRASIAYFIADTKEPAQTELIENIKLKGLETILFNGKEVPVKQTSSSKSNGKRSLGYELQTLDLGVSVEKIERVDAVGKVLESLLTYRPADRFSFYIQETLIETPIHLKFTFKPMVQKTVILNERIDLGSPSK